MLWLTDSFKTAKEDAQAGAFVRTADPTRLKVDLLALGPGDDHRFKHDFHASGGSVYQVNALSRGDIGAFLRLRRRVKEGRYDLIHAHSSWASIWGSRVGRLLRVPVVATLYDPRVDPSGKTNLHKEEEQAIRALRRWGTRVVALSGAQWDRYVQGGAFSRSFLEVVYQGVAVSETPVGPEEREAAQIWLRRHASFPPGANIAVTIADLDDWESGVDVLLWAIPKIVRDSPQTRFVIIGEGEHSEELDRRIRARGLNHLISWHRNHDDVRQILMGSDLFIHPSLRDPFPVSVLNAMSAELPVVGTRVGGVPEIIGTSEAGRLVPRSDPDALAEAAVELFRDPPRLAVMGRAAADRVRKMFTLSGWADRMEQLYREVIDDVQAGRSTRPNSYARLDVRLLGLDRRETSHARTSNRNGRSPRDLSLQEPVPVGAAG